MINFIMGLDLGQQNDYTVLSIIRIKLEGKEASYGLVHLGRYPLKTSYPSIIDQTIGFIDNNFIKKDYSLIVDYTGVGRPVVDLFRDKGMTIIAANITSGFNPTWRNQQEVGIPKKDIISSLQVVLQNKKLRIAADLKLLPELKKEFLNFTSKISQSGSASYSAKSGHHDDIVMSIGLATWYGEYAFKKGRKVRILTGN